MIKTLQDLKLTDTFVGFHGSFTGKYDEAVFVDEHNRDLLCGDWVGYHSPMVEKFRDYIRYASRWYADCKLYQDLPYIYHCLMVMDILNDAGASDDCIIAGLFHDILEDTKITPCRLAHDLPKKAYDMVEAVTDEPGANRKERAAKTYPKIASTEDAILVKMADRLCNMTKGGAQYYDMYFKEMPKFFELIREAKFSPENESAYWKLRKQLWLLK